MGNKINNINKVNKEKVTYDKTFKNMKQFYEKYKAGRTMEGGIIILLNFKKNFIIYGILGGHEPQLFQN